MTVSPLARIPRSLLSTGAAAVALAFAWGFAVPAMSDLQPGGSVGMASSASLASPVSAGAGIG